jgi:hypothetical protein
MKKSVLLISLFLGFVFQFNSVLALEFSINRFKKDIVRTDTIFSAIRMGTELKFILNKQGEFGVMFNEEKVITVLSDGKTGFGTDNPQYRIDVCGSIRASEEIIVEPNGWCDFVFSNEYVLESLHDRLSGIYIDKHLPYIKSESEIMENGMPVTETITGLLRNVEELYLYVEKLERRIDELEEENQSLKNQK